MPITPKSGILSENCQIAQGISTSELNEGEPVFCLEEETMKIRPAVSERDLEQIKRLFREYFEWIIRDLGIDMSYQGVEDELLSLPGAFSLPDGCLLLAESDGQAAGCVALRRLGAHTCEMKRMYVSENFKCDGLK